jgi:hypothetical protein
MTTASAVIPADLRTDVEALSNYHDMHHELRRTDRLLATSGRHRPGRPATLADYKTLKTSGLCPAPRPSSEIAVGDPLAGHPRGYQPPQPGPRSFVR